MSARTVETFADVESLLRKQHAELDLLFRNTPVGLALLDQQLHYLKANDILALWHGIEPAEFVGRPLQGILSGWHESVASRFHEALSNGKAVLNIELTLLCAVPPFAARHFLAHLFPLRCETEKNIAAGLAMVDVTDRKHAEETLSNSEARYRDIVEHSVYGVCAVNADGGTTTANAAMQRILGRTTREELSGINF